MNDANNPTVNIVKLLVHKKQTHSGEPRTRQEQEQHKFDYKVTGYSKLPRGIAPKTSRSNNNPPEVDDSSEKYPDLTFSVGSPPKISAHGTIYISALDC